MRRSSAPCCWMVSSKMAFSSLFQSRSIQRVSFFFHWREGSGSVTTIAGGFSLPSLDDLISSLRQTYLRPCARWKIVVSSLPSRSRGCTSGLPSQEARFWPSRLRKCQVASCGILRCDIHFSTEKTRQNVDSEGKFDFTYHPLGAFRKHNSEPPRWSRLRAPPHL